MKLSPLQKEEFLGVVSRGNKAESEAWLEALEPRESDPPVGSANTVPPEAPKSVAEAEEDESKSKKKGK